MAPYGHTPPFQHLLEWLNRRATPAYSVYTGAFDNERFFAATSIETYFQDKNFKYTKRLLATIFPDGRGPAPKNVAQICPRVFCILASMEMAVVQHIDSFVRFNSLWDERLPFEVRPEHFPREHGDDHDEFWRQFYEKQWRFCAPKLRSLHAYHFGDNLILPFTALQRAGSGGSATVYKATVHSSHDQLTQPDPPLTGNVYALKIFRTKTSADYHRELNAFKSITESGTRTAHGIIKFYGSFAYRKTFCLVLEYADGGNLEDYLHRQPPPSSGSNIIDFWESLFVTLEALFRIHQQHLNPDENGTGKLLQGWHQDLKPKNILIVMTDPQRPYTWLFKIADLGLSHFRTIMEGEPEATDLDSFGTKTYGAPECYTWTDTTAKRRTTVLRSIDVWSLGSIYSEVAAWVANGPEQLLRYRRERKKETDHLSDFRDGNCFHNGTKRLSTVDEHHRLFKRQLSGEDFITGKILDQMVVEMLQVKPEIRPSAEQLISKAERLIENAREDLPQTTVGIPPTMVPDARYEPLSPRQTYNQDRLDLRELHAGDSSHVDPFAPSSSRQPYPRPLPLPRRRNDAFLQQELHGAFSVPVRPKNSPPDRIQTVHAPEPIGYMGQEEDPMSPKTPTQQREAPPFCSVEDAIKWHSQMKSGNKTAKLPYHDELMWELKNRDHVFNFFFQLCVVGLLTGVAQVFIVDDSRSMHQHRNDVEKLIRVLAYITKNMDPDRLELYFLGSDKPQKFKHASELALAVKVHKADKWTNLNLLDTDLRKYIAAIDREKGPQSFFGKAPRLNKRSIYVFTDGVWQTGTNDQGRDPIKAMTEKLNDLQYPRNQIGVQFIRFGNDETGRARLDTLDNLSRHLGLTRDIVDTEPFDGNVWKMLLGAINEKFDDDEIQLLSPQSLAATTTRRSEG